MKDIEAIWRSRCVGWTPQGHIKGRQGVGRAFASLSKLTYVDLEGNKCINEVFNGIENAEIIAKMPRIITSKCSSKEPNVNGKLDSDANGEICQF